MEGDGQPRDVGLLRHDTLEEETYVWTLAQLLAAVRKRRPRRNGDPDWTFLVGDRPEYLAISTAGPRAFIGQHPVWGEGETFEGNMMFDGLRWDNVGDIFEMFYRGRMAETCFAPYHGIFRFRIRDD